MQVFSYVAEARDWFIDNASGSISVIISNAKVTFSYHRNVLGEVDPTYHYVI